MGDQKPIAIYAHPPERRRAPASTIAACCCCCCCCCLHTFAGLTGGGMATASRFEGGSAGEKAYWWAVAGVAIVAGVWTSVTAEMPAAGCFTLALAMPVLQLIASLIALLAVPFFAPEHRGPSRRKIGWITLWSFIGALGGGLIMIAILLLFSTLT